jgi:hypothetical protein
MDLQKLSLTELKAAVWDLEYNLRLVNNELNVRLSNQPVDTKTAEDIGEPVKEKK